ncbi:hypothetical protein IJM16_01105 [Candidatus Saccharibacteria bacterium]|nr:hypothetical protein [Candidatus Saccharibacteria bacterium]
MKIKKLSMLAAVGAMFATALAPLANVSAWTVSPVSGNGSKVTIKREVKNTSNNVTNTFTYSVSADTTNNPAAVSGYPTAASIVFNNVAPTNNTAVKTADLDFSSAVFTKVGDYNFTITETGSTDTTSYPTSTKSYVVTVSVRNETSSGAPTGEHVATLGSVKEYSATNKLTTILGNDTEVVFDAGAVRTYATLTKQVTGNNADEDACFGVKLSLAGGAGLSYSISGSTCPDQPAAVAGNGDTIVYIKHNETITIGRNNNINEIPLGSTFKAEEQGATDYETFIDGSTTNSKTSAMKTLVDAGASTFNTANRINIVNHKETPPRTGVVFSILPFIIIALIGIFGAAYVAKTKKVTE